MDVKFDSELWKKGITIELYLSFLLLFFAELFKTSSQKHSETSFFPLCDRSSSVNDVLEGNILVVHWRPVNGRRLAVRFSAVRRCLPCLLQTAAGRALRYRNGGGGVGRRLADFQAFRG